MPASPIVPAADTIAGVLSVLVLDATCSLGWAQGDNQEAWRGLSQTDGAVAFIQSGTDGFLSLSEGPIMSSTTTYILMIMID